MTGLRVSLYIPCGIGDLPDGRREPVLESESFTSVTPEFTILGQLEESEVDPCYEETELD